MRRRFIESGSFTKRADRAGDAVRRAIEDEVMRDPDAGDVIPGTGGFRKLRISDPGRGKGKRGGFRVVYIDLPALGRTYLLKLYSKDEQDDLSSEQKRELKRVATELTSEDIQ